MGELLLRPDADRLSRFAFRRAAEMAAEGRPSEAGAWMRLVAQAGRAAERLDRLSHPFSPADHMRAQYAADLRAAFMGDFGEGDAGEEDEGAPESEGGVAECPPVR